MISDNSNSYYSRLMKQFPRSNRDDWSEEFVDENGDDSSSFNIKGKESKQI